MGIAKYGLDHLLKKILKKNKFKKLFFFNQKGNLEAVQSTLVLNAYASILL